MEQFSFSRESKVAVNTREFSCWLGWWVWNSASVIIIFKQRFIIKLGNDLLSKTYIRKILVGTLMWNKFFDFLKVHNKLAKVLKFGTSRPFFSFRNSSLKNPQSLGLIMVRNPLINSWKGLRLFCWQCSRHRNTGSQEKRL